MTNFKSQDYKDMLYPVHNLKRDVDIFKTFPKLKDYSEFSEKLIASLPIDKVFKYIVYVYDQKSPFFTQIEDLVQRKKAAVLEAGFEPNASQNFSTSIKGMLNCENPAINSMIIRYCRMQGKNFANLVASIEAFHQINLQLISNINGQDDDAIVIAKKKADLDKAADDLSNRLNEKARRFLSQEVAEGLHEDLWSLAEDEALNIKITPEDFS